MQTYEEYLKSLPKKRAGSAAIFLNSDREILIVKPNYKEGWIVPGGSIELNESPHDGCIREIKEEIGLDVSMVQFLGVNYVLRKVKEDEYDEGFHFIFFGGMLTPEQIAEIKIQKEELDEYRFVSAEEAYTLLNERLGKRIKEGMEALLSSTPFYSEYKV